MITFQDYPQWASLTTEEAQKWLQFVGEQYGRQVRRLTYHFVDDKEIMEINQRYLNHDYETDIISFGYEEGSKVSGEIFIGIETVIRNSSFFGSSPEEELDRVLVHGLLHFCGLNDHSVEEKEKMRAEEEKCLLLRAKILNDN